MTVGMTVRRTGSWCVPWCCWRSWSGPTWPSCSLRRRGTLSWGSPRRSACRRLDCSRTCWEQGDCIPGTSSSVLSFSVEHGGWRTKPDKNYYISTSTVNICSSNLYPGLAELGPLTEFLSGVDVGILSPLERFLQLIKLISREGCPWSSLLPLQRNARLSLGIRSFLGTLGFDWTNEIFIFICICIWHYYVYSKKASRPFLKPLLALHINRWTLFKYSGCQTEGWKMGRRCV